MIDLPKLKEIASRALSASRTWEEAKRNGLTERFSAGQRKGIMSAKAAYRRAMRPSTALELIARLEKAEELLEEAEQEMVAPCENIQHLRRRIRAFLAKEEEAEREVEG